jgi:hypothetical protein
LEQELVYVEHVSLCSKPENKVIIKQLLDRIEITPLNEITILIFGILYTTNEEMSKFLLNTLPTLKWKTFKNESAKTIFLKYIKLLVLEMKEEIKNSKYSTEYQFVSTKSPTKVLFSN